MKKIFVLGSINCDMVIKSPYMPVNGETITGSDFMTNSGGKGANQAVACALLGGDVSMIGSVGRDGFGRDCLKSVSGYGVDTRFVRETDGSTGVAVIIVVDGNNRIILDGGANYRFDPEYVRKVIDENVSEGDIFVTQLEISEEIVESGLKDAKAKGAVTVLNPAPARPLPKELLHYVDYILPNETEAEILTGVKVDDEASILAAGKAFAELGVRNTIITLGKRGCALVRDGACEIFASVEMPVVDTTAAGDTFLGAFCCLLSKGYDERRAIRIAQCASSITVSRAGAQQSIPTMEEVEELIKSRNIVIG